MTSKRRGLRTTRAASASMSILSRVTPGVLATTPATTSSQNGIVWMMPLDLVAEVIRPRRAPSQLDGELGHPVDPVAGEDRLLDRHLLRRARGRAARRPRSTRLRRSPGRSTRSMPGPRPAAGDETPGRMRTGRRLTYCWNSRRIGISRPHSVTSSGDVRCADRAEEDRVVPLASWSMPSRASSGRGPGSSPSPSRDHASRPRIVRPREASTQRMAAGTTSWPMPSPAMTSTW